MRIVFLFIFIILLVFNITTPVFAESTYVLPYPGNMPGSIWYKLDQIKEKVDEVLYFGDLAKFKYNLQQSDKYLVEAKTLFEYRQYLLGREALLKSDKYFNKIEPRLANANKNGKNILEKKTILKNAAEKHIEILSKLKSEVPTDFTWTPEKENPTVLNLEREFDEAIKIRKSLND